MGRDGEGKLLKKFSGSATAYGWRGGKNSGGGLIERNRTNSANRTLSHPPLSSLSKSLFHKNDVPFYTSTGPQVHATWLTSRLEK